MKRQVKPDTPSDELSSSVFENEDSEVVLPDIKRFKHDMKQMLGKIKSEDNKVEKDIKKAVPSTTSAKRLIKLTDPLEAVTLRYLTRPAVTEEVSKDYRIQQLVTMLRLRQRYRDNNQPVFDVDRFVNETLQKVDRYQPDPSNPNLAIPIPKSFPVPVNLQVPPVTVPYLDEPFKLGPVLTTACPADGDVTPSHMTPSHMTSLVSPYTKQILNPVIWVDHECQPRRLKLLAELQQHKRYQHNWNRKENVPCRTAITYTYFQKHQLKAVDALVTRFFWKGTNIKECLEYPDFTVVALCEKLVIGFGCLTPNVWINEAYLPFLIVHPEWQSAGIGSFMLYHLVQACVGNDITLHVAVNNPAVFLYQKFGFKIEQVCLEFYNKYYPPEYYYSKNAFLMRLKK